MFWPVKTAAQRGVGHGAQQFFLGGGPGANHWLVKGWNIQCPPQPVDGQLTPPQSPRQFGIEHRAQQPDFAGGPTAAGQTEVDAVTLPFSNHFPDGATVASG